MAAELQLCWGRPPSHERSRHPHHAAPLRPPLGRGVIAEEATYVAEHHEPAIQLLEFEDGSLSVRFCYYDHAGRFQRSPLVVGKGDIEGMRQALANRPRLRELLRDMVQ